MIEILFASFLDKRLKEYTIMMSRTHLAMGIVTSLAVCQPKTISDCMFTLAGGAVGGVLADIDILDNDYRADALIGQLCAIGIIALTCGIDFFFKMGVCDYIFSENKFKAIVGCGGFIITWIKGFNSDHRGFTHSLIAMLVFSLCLGIIYLWLGISCLAGYFSHLALDILNKRKIRLLYPLKGGICLKIFYANRTANEVFMYVGFVLAVLVFCIRMIMVL